MALNEGQYEKPYSLPHIENMGFDPIHQMPIRGLVGFDPTIGENGGYKLLSTLSQGDYAVADIEEDGTLTYMGFEDISGSWYIMKIDESSDTSFRFASVVNNTGQTTGYSDAWDDRATLTYDTRSTAF